MNQIKQPSAAAGRTLAVSGLTLFVLGAMLWEIVSTYLAGGNDAPTVGVLVAALIVLGGGMVFAAFLIFRQIKQFQSEETQNSEEDVSET